MVDKNKIGFETPPRLYEVERGAILRFVQAIGDENPLYRDPEAARAAGYRDVIAPPTFPITFTEEPPVFIQIGASFKRILHGGQEFEYFTPLYPGDKITLTTKVENIVAKEGKSGRMDIITLVGTGTKEDGAVAFKATSTLVERF